MKILRTVWLGVPDKNESNLNILRVIFIYIYMQVKLMLKKFQVHTIKNMTCSLSFKREFCKYVRSYVWYYLILQ